MFNVIHSNTWFNFLLVARGLQYIFILLRRGNKNPAFSVVVHILIDTWLVWEVSCGRGLPVVGVQKSLEVLLEVGRVEEHRVGEVLTSGGHLGVASMVCHRALKHSCLSFVFQVFLSLIITEISSAGSALPPAKMILSLLTILLHHFLIPLTPYIAYLKQGALNL